MKPFDSIICVSQTTWEGDFQKAVVQLMTELSVRHKILFVNYQYTAKDLFMRFTGRRTAPAKQLIGLANPLVKKTLDSGHEVYIWTPPLMLPTNWLPNRAHDLLNQWNVNRLTKGLRRVMKQLAMTRPVVINAFNPVLGYAMLNRLNEYGTIYYCFDEISVEPWTGRHGSRFEPLYMKQVNAVVTTSETLRQVKSAIQPNTFCVKNGVNFALFHQAYYLSKEIPEKKPVVGYLGTADDRINIDLVEYCVRTMPDVSFQFIGEVTRPWIVPRLSVYANVTFMPPHQPAQLPALLAQMKVAIIPYACNTHTYTIYPLKVNEYLAAGLPVVSTTFSILDDFEGIIDLADTPEAFAHSIRLALTDTDPLRESKRIATARSNSWKNRAQEFETVIESMASSPFIPEGVFAATQRNGGSSRALR